MPKLAASVSIPTKLVATGLALALTAVVCGTAATVMAASSVQHVARAKRGPALSPAAIAELSRKSGHMRALLDSLSAGGPAHDAATAEDVAAMAVLTTYGKSPESHAVMEHAAAIPGPLPSIAFWPGTVSDAVAHASDSALRSKSNNTAKAWLPAFRRWSRSATMPALWGYAKGLPTVQTIQELPIRAFQPTRALFTANEQQAIIALRAGNFSVAMERARENVAGSRHFVNQPLLIDALIGRILARRGAELLAIAADSMHDSVTARMAMRLDSVAKAVNDYTIVQSVALLEANAHSTAAETIAADRSVHPAVRIDALGTIVAGGCHNTRELLFGFSNDRHKSLVRAAMHLGDVGRAGELATLYVRGFDQLRDDPEGLIARIMRVNAMRAESPGALDWIVPPAVRARIGICKVWGM